MTLTMSLPVEALLLMAASLYKVPDALPARHDARRPRTVSPHSGGVQVPNDVSEEQVPEGSPHIDGRSAAYAMLLFAAGLGWQRAASEAAERAGMG